MSLLDDEQDAFAAGSLDQQGGDMSLPQPQMRQKSSEIHAVIAEIEARRVRAVRISLQIIALVLIVVALLLPLLARAATSADVEREAWLKPIIHAATA